MTKNELINEIWITPFSAQGIAVYYACLRRGIRVLGFIDGSQRCRGVIFQGVPVLSFEEYSGHSGFIGIASTHFQHVFLRQLTKQGVSVHLILDGIAFLDEQSIEYAMYQATEQNIEALYPVKRFGDTLMRTADELKCRRLITNTLSTSVSVLEFVVTTRCNLKCRDCANLMQYYKDPSHIDTGTILRSIDRVFQLIDSIVQVNLLGGEPLLNPDLPQILDKLGEYRSNIKNLNITTNGTILPKGELIDALIRNNATMTVSDYGKLSGKRLQLITLLDENGIGVKDLKDQVWNTPHTFCQNLARKQQEIGQTFRTCSAQCMEVIEGKLSYCVFQAHAENLHAIPKADYESLDLMGEQLTKEEVRELCYPSSPLYACRYCTGMNYENPSIPPAVQTNVPLPYHVYD
jgi:organic radical activating enzyme